MYVLLTTVECKYDNNFLFDMLLTLCINPPSCDHFGRHGAAGDLICKKVSLNQKSWWLIGDWAKPLTWGVSVWINLFCVFGSLLVDLRVCKLLQHKEHIYEGMFNFPACFLNMTCFLSVYDEHWLTEYVGCLLVG